MEILDRIEGYLEEKKKDKTKRKYTEKQQKFIGHGSIKDILRKKGKLKESEINESLGGYLIDKLGEMEEMFNNHAGFYNGKYPITKDPNQMLTPKAHKACIKALDQLTNAMKAGYKGKLRGF